MIVGLVFANRETDGTAGQLAATEPFAGATLIEHQARLLAGLGAAQIIAIAAQPTPALTGAIGRIARRTTIDRVGHLADAAAIVHPLANVIILADGIVGTSALLAPLAGEGGEVLVAAADDGSGRYERLGGGMIWAGAARIAAERLTEAAALPRDYDPQSALLRLAAQAGAATAVVLIAASVTIGRGGVHSEQANALLLDRVALRPNWFSRWVVRPIAAVAVRQLAAHPLPATAIVAAIVGAGLAGVVAIAADWTRSGLILALAATIIAPLGSALLGFRGDERAQVVIDVAAWLVPAIAVLALGETAHQPVLALVLVAIAGLGERAHATTMRWSGDPGAYLILVTLAAIAGAPVIGLGIAAVYAFATLAVQIERLRQRA